MSLKFGSQIVLAIAAFLFCNLSASAQTAYELNLGMYEHEVRGILHSKLGEIEPKLSIDGQTVYRNEEHTLFFCKKRLIAFSISLSPGVSAWSRAVEQEIAGRGIPEYKLDHRIWGGVSAKWRVEPYRFLSISMTQYDDDGPITVERWLTDLRKCEMS